MVLTSSGRSLKPLPGRLTMRTSYQPSSSDAVLSQSLWVSSKPWMSSRMNELEPRRWWEAARPPRAYHQRNVPSVPYPAGVGVCNLNVVAQPLDDLGEHGTFDIIMSTRRIGYK